MRKIALYVLYIQCIPHIKMNVLQSEADAMAQIHERTEPVLLDIMERSVDFKKRHMPLYKITANKNYFELHI